MKLKDLTTPYERKRVVTLKADNTTATIKGKELQLIHGTLYRDATSSDNYGMQSCYFYAYFEDVGLGIDLGSVIAPDERELDEVIRSIKSDYLDTLAAFTAELDRRAEVGEFISNIVLEFARQAIPNRFRAYCTARAAYNDNLARRIAERKAQREAAEAAFCKEENEKSQAILEHALEVVRNGGVLENKIVSFFKSRHSYISRSVINHIAIQHGVKIPLRVQGWINNSLSRVTIQDAATRGYHADTRSETFRKYMDQVIAAVRGGDRP